MSDPFSYQLARYHIAERLSRIRELHRPEPSAGRRDRAPRRTLAALLRRLADLVEPRRMVGSQHADVGTDGPIRRHRAPVQGH